MPLPAVDVPGIPLHVAGDRALRDQLGRDARQQPLDGLVTPGQQGVRVPALPDALAVLVVIGHGVAVEHRDPCELRVQSGGGQEPRHARADDDGVVHRSPW